MEASHYYEYYLQQASQRGEGQVYHGSVYQRGYGLGGLFRNLFNFIRPIIKPAAKFVGKEILKTGSNILSDVVSGRNVKEAAKEHLSAAAGEHIGEFGSQLVDGAVNRLKDVKKRMLGNGRPLKRRHAHSKSHSSAKRLKRRTLDILD